MFVVKWKQTLLLYKANPLFYKLERWPQLAGLFKQGNALKIFFSLVRQLVEAEAADVQHDELGHEHRHIELRYEMDHG